MPVEGPIADRARGILPVTWDALSREARFGDALLQSTINTVKEKTFGNTTQSEIILPLIVIDYVAKLVALELITPAMDYWRAEGPTSIGTTGTNEQESYTDPIAMLTALRADLLADTRRSWAEVRPIIGFSRISGASRPKSNTIDDEFLTPSPQEFPRPYRVTDRS